MLAPESHWQGKQLNAHARNGTIEEAYLHDSVRRRLLRSAPETSAPSA